MSKLQRLARKRNSAKGRIKGLKNNLKGLLEDKEAEEFLEEEEIVYLEEAQAMLEESERHWDRNWNRIKKHYG